MCRYPCAKTVSGKLRVMEQRILTGPSPRLGFLGLLFEQVIQQQTPLSHLEELNTLITTTMTSVTTKTQVIQQIIPFSRKVHNKEA